MQLDKFVKIRIKRITFETRLLVGNKNLKYSRWKIRAEAGVGDDDIGWKRPVELFIGTREAKEIFVVVKIIGSRCQGCTAPPRPTGKSAAP